MIKYFELIYYFLAFVPGVSLNILMVIIYTKHKNIYLRLFTVAYLATSLLVFYYLVNNFIILLALNAIFRYLIFAEVILMSIIIWSVSTLIMKLFYEIRSAIQKIFVLFLSLVPLLIYSLCFSGIYKLRWVNDIYYIYLIIILLVNCMLFLLKYKQIDHKSFRKLGRIIVSALSIFLIFFVIQSYVKNFNFDTFPLFYLLLTANLIFFIWNHFFKDNINDVLNISKSFIEKYKITKREQEIIELIQSGCSNISISKKLFVSEKTVANHIYNIYKKLNIASRFELICLFKK